VYAARYTPIQYVGRCSPTHMRATKEPSSSDTGHRKKSGREESFRRCQLSSKAPQGTTRLPRLHYAFFVLWERLDISAGWVLLAARPLRGRIILHGLRRTVAGTVWRIRSDLEVHTAGC